VNKEPELSEDLFLGGKVHLLQPVKGYRAATDPVFLAASIPARAGQSVLDVGCGVGAAGFCLAARVEGVKISGIDIQKKLIEIGEQNRVLNKMEERVRFVCADLLYRSMDPLPNSFDHVIANPPFYEAGSGHRPPNEIKARAHMEVKDGATVQHWVDYMLRMAKPKGTVTCINRVERLEETLAALQGRVGELILFPIWSMNPSGTQARGAKRFILQGRKGIKTPLKFANGLVVHEDDGSYTAQSKAILQDGAALALL
jgi:tRNA1(Val) A37 N6-methylase TrmN6